MFYMYVLMEQSTYVYNRDYVERLHEYRLDCCCISYLQVDII